MRKPLSFEQEFTRLQPRYIHVLRYIRQALATDEVQWSDLTRPNLALVADHIKDSVSPNTAVLYLAIIKSVLNMYKDENLFACSHPEAVLKARKAPQQNVALTLDELNRIINYYDILSSKLFHQKEKDILTLFLIECLCGARSCDVANLSLKNIHGDKLSYVSQKTQTLAVVPVHHLLPTLLQRIPRIDYNRAIKARTIKRVARLCGISQPVTIFYHGSMQTRPKYEFLGTHTARRTFASILAAKGVPLADISQYMAHTSLAMTERYIKADLQRVSPEAQTFFQPA